MFLSVKKELTPTLLTSFRASIKRIFLSLSGIFGDASWTNKERLSDETLINLIEHYSQHKLNISNVPDDQLGNAYEYLIKKFADDSGHTAAEFYTNRTVVKLMTMIMDPQPGESVYDPTCGSGGLLLNCALHLKDEGKEYRALKLYGQEINLITSSIARMNMFLHGIEEFSIVRGDTLANPAFIEHDGLKKFNVILANPPYSIKSWDQKGFESDPYGRNIWGTPPQGCADYAFQQHIHQSLDEKNGRTAILWPHGILFRDMEKQMREEMIRTDVVECIIGLGPNLFYNSPMEASILICNNNKKPDRERKILFIDALNEVKRVGVNSFLTDKNINKIHIAYSKFEELEGFSKIITMQEVIENNANLKVSKYIRSSKIPNKESSSLGELHDEFIESSTKLELSMNKLFKAV
jgi:type I restriction enzyme M protein